MLYQKSRLCHYIFWKNCNLVSQNENFLGRFSDLARNLRAKVQFFHKDSFSMFIKLGCCFTSLFDLTKPTTLAEWNYIMLEKWKNSLNSVY